MTEDDFDTLRLKIRQLIDNLPEAVDLGGLSKRYKTAGKVHLLRESLIWRAEEFARNASGLLDAGDCVAAALLTRALMETTAALVYLHGLVQKGLNIGISRGLDEKLTGFLVGSKKWGDTGKAIHVNDMLKEVEKVIPGFFTDHYATLSEYAHPNWQGAFGAYSTTDQKRLIVTFSRDGRLAENHRKQVGSILFATVDLLSGYYNFVSDMLQPFADAVEAFHTANPDETMPGQSG